MRHLLALMFLASCGAPPATPPGPSEPAEVRLAIVGTNDLHGHVERLPILGGYLDNLAAETNVLLVDGGDMFQGTIASNLSEGALCSA